MSTDIAAFVEGLVHEPTQTGDRGVDLTAGAIHEVRTPGRVDFGGDELAAAETAEIEAVRRSDDDEYGWWDLDAGTYLLEYNESLDAPDDLTVTLQTRDALLERGAFHPTLQVRELSRVPLTVGGAGLRIKENARISTLVGVERA